MVFKEKGKKIALFLIILIAVLFVWLIASSLYNLEANSITLRSQVIKMSENMNVKDTIKYKMLNAPFFMNSIEGRYIKTEEYKNPEMSIDNILETNFMIDYDNGQGYAKINIINGYGEITGVHEIFQNKETVNDYLDIKESAIEEIKSENLEKYGTLKTVEKANMSSYIEPEKEISDINPKYVEMLGSLDRIDNGESKRVTNDNFLTKAMKNEINDVDTIDESLPALLGFSVSVGTDEVTAPQLKTILLLNEKNNWNIIEKTTYLERSAYVIEGNVSAEVKPNFDSFKLVVDEETGILLYSEINYNDQDYLLKSSKIEVTEINISNNDTQLKSFSTPLTTIPTSKENKEEYLDVIAFQLKEEREMFYIDVLSADSTEVNQQDFNMAREMYLKTPEQEQEFKDFIKKNPDLVKTDFYKELLLD